MSDSKYKKITTSKAEITKLTRDYCTKQGWYVATVEKYNSHSRTFSDLFGFADMLVIDDIEEPGVLLIQITTEANAQHHINDVLYDLKKRVYAKELLIKNNRIWYFFYKKDNKGKWQRRIQKLTLDDF